MLTSIMQILINIGNFLTPYRIYDKIKIENKNTKGGIFMKKTDLHIIVAMLATLASMSTVMAMMFMMFFR